MNKSNKVEMVWKAGLWTGRLLALLLFLFWGAFFVEHLVGWFVEPFPKTPPPKIWLGQALHGVMLASLLVLWRWPLAGTLLLAISAFAFFGPRAGDSAPLFFAVTMLPALLIMLCSRRFHPPRTPNQAQNPIT